jgi:hypothetical protein
MTALEHLRYICEGATVPGHKCTFKYVLYIFAIQILVYDRDSLHIEASIGFLSALFGRDETEALIRATYETLDGGISWSEFNESLLYAGQQKEVDALSGSHLVQLWMAKEATIVLLIGTQTASMTLPNTIRPGGQLTAASFQAIPLDGFCTILNC